MDHVWIERHVIGNRIATLFGKLQHTRQQATIDEMSTEFEEMDLACPIPLLELRHELRAGHVEREILAQFTGHMLIAFNTNPDIIHRHKRHAPIYG